MTGIVLNEKRLQKAALAVAVLWVVVQIVLIACFWGYPQKTDMAYYISTAQRCFANRQWYPMAEDVYSQYIWAPGFINYLVLQLHIFGTVNFNAVLNLFLNIGILLEVYYLGQKFFSKRTGLISVIIFVFLYSNLLIVLGANTENPFLFLCLSALCLVFSGKFKYIILAAVLFALANWIRPLVIIFLFASVVYFVITKTKFYNYIALIIPCILVIFIIGTLTEKKIGYFVYQSTHSGLSLLMTSHNKAKGIYYEFSVHDVDFIENGNSITFVEKDSIYRARALTWIKENPAKYAALFLLKIPALYIHDSWVHTSHWADNSSVDFLNETSKSSKNAFIKKLTKQVFQSIPYYITFLFFLYALWINRKKIFNVKSVFLVILISGTFINCIFPVTPRYHYPFMFIIIIYAAWGLDTFIERKKQLR
jgi:4-amino-4-deoxy-L-arabinose transferase-like glycosyltransferase